MKPSALPYYALSAVQILRSVRPLGRVVELLRRPQATSVRLPGLDLEFDVRDFMDVWCLKETFLNRDYIAYGFQPQPGWTIIDVGAALGDYAVQARRDFGAGRVIAVEPAPSAISLLRRNLDRNGAADVEIVDRALSDRPGSLWLDTSGAPLTMGTSETRGGGSDIAVGSVTPAMLYDELGIERCDLLKLDCEGAEFTLLGDGSAGFLARTDRVVLEFHEAQATRGRNRHTLAATLERAGFDVEIFENRVHRDLGYIRAARPRKPPATRRSADSDGVPAAVGRFMPREPSAEIHDVSPTSPTT